RSQGFAALERGDVATAQARFEAVLAQRPSDADALGGLGLLRLRAEQFTEAEQLLDRASRAAPGAQSRWREALASARFFSGLRQAQAALAAGDTARARSLAEGLRAPAAEDQALAQMVSAESLRRERRWADAETAYRAVLQSSPDSEDARLGLLEALIGRNTPESQAQAQQLAADLNRQGVGGARLGQVLAQAELARATALADQGDLAGAAAAFQSALASQPANAWIRYDYARFLDAQGQGLAADGLMAGARQLGDPENLYALALYLDQKGRLTEAQGLLAQIPPAALTAPMAEFARELEQRAAISQLAALAASGEAYQAIPTLRAYAGQPDLPLGLRGQIALALYDAGDQGQALALAQAALLAPPGSEPAAYAGFVKVLARAGRDIEAAGLIRRISTEAAATPAARRELASLGAALGVERAERLRQGGDLAGAFDALSQAYSLAPQDADILKALGRLYMAGDLHANAQGVYQGLLALRPNDPDALAGLAEAALAQNDPQTARRSIRQAIAQAPENVDLLLLAARVEQSAGDRAAARRALEEARRLRERQMAAAAGRGMGLPGAPGGLGPNPFLRQLAPSAWAAPGLAALPQAAPAPVRLALGAARPWAASLAAADLPLPGRAAAPAPAASPWSVAQTTPSATSPYGPAALAWPVAPAAPVTTAPAAAFNPFALPSAPAPSAAPQGFYAP
ncbi:MAG TPA: tetratricopeptide repeat protein, partial [Phenylobacterium sp.]|nr:tetratricopeptide repeat protein [Phenylobacterium sp.]